MAAPACGSLRHIFENTISENKSSSPWNHIKTLKPPLDHSFTEIFGELHFKENHSNPTSLSSTSSIFTPPPPPSAFPIDLVSQSSNINKLQDEKGGGIFTSFTTNDGYSRPYHHRMSDSFSSLNSDSLQLCTEGLGSESLGDVEDLTMEVNMKEKVHVRRHSIDSYCRKIRTNGKAMFPPPISYIGQAGKPSVSFQSYRHDGRFVLREVRIPTQECLQASREDGRLRLSIVQPDDIEEEDDEEEEGDDDDDDNDNVVEDDGGEEGEEEMSSVGRIDDDEEEEEERTDGVEEEDDPAVRVDLVRSYS